MTVKVFIEQLLFNLNKKLDKLLNKLLNNMLYKLAKYPKSNENKHEPKNIGYYSINKNVMTE